MIRSLCVAIPIFLAATVQAGAQNIVGRASGLTAGTFASFDFNGLAIPNESAVTNQLLANGLRFTGAYYGLVSPVYGPSFVTPALYNYSGQVASTVIEVAFSTAVNAVAFNFATTPGESTFAVYRNNTMLRMFSSGAPNLSEAERIRWWGFEFQDGTMFDKLVVTNNPIPSVPFGFGLDNLQVGVRSVVPEPSSLALLLGGLLAVGAMVRRGAAHND